MGGEFSVYGYDVEGLLSATPSGERWLARAQATGEWVTLKRIRVRGAEAVGEVRGLVARLAEMAHPHVLRVRDIIAAGDEIMLVEDHAPGGSLAQLLRVRGRLDPGEVVTTIAPVTEAVAAAHERQIWHSAITPEVIVYTSRGFPLLADLGVLDISEATGITSGGTRVAAVTNRLPRAADVYSLAAICYAALTGEPPPGPADDRRPLHELAPGAPPGLTHAVEAGLHHDPVLRPSALRFADLLYAATQPVPVRFPPGIALFGGDTSRERASHLDQANGEPETRKATGLHDRPQALADRRWGLLEWAAAGALLLFGLVLGSVVWAKSGDDDSNNAAQQTSVSSPAEAAGSRQSPVEQTPVPPPPDDPELRQWWEVLTELDAKRAGAFAQADPDLLAEVYTPDALVLQGDSEEENDRLKVQAFAEADSAAEGVRFHIHEMAVIAEDDDEVVLRVVDELQPYTVVGPSGAREPREGGQRTARTFTLHRLGGKWLIYNITS